MNPRTKEERKDLKRLETAHAIHTILKQKPFPNLTPLTYSFVTGNDTDYTDPTPIAIELGLQYQPVHLTQTKWDTRPTCGACFWNALHYCLLHKSAKFVLGVQIYNGKMWQHAFVEDNGQYLEITLTPEEKVDDTPLEIGGDTNIPQANSFSHSTFGAMKSFTHEEIIEWYRINFGIKNIKYFTTKYLYFVPGLNLWNLLWTKTI